MLGASACTVASMCSVPVPLLVADGGETSACEPGEARGRSAQAKRAKQKENSLRARIEKTENTLKRQYDELAEIRNTKRRKVDKTAPKLKPIVTKTEWVEEPSGIAALNVALEKMRRIDKELKERMHRVLIAHQMANAA